MIEKNEIANKDTTVRQVVQSYLKNQIKIGLKKKKNAGAKDKKHI